MSSYQPEDNLASWLSTFVDNYEAEFEEYWDLGGEAPSVGADAADWELGRVLDQIGKDLVASVHVLRLHPEVVERIALVNPGDPEVAAAKELSTNVVAYDRLEIELARQSVDRLFDAKERAFHLLGLLAKFAPSERASAYLDRTTRLYLWGFDEEVAILCRATLEASLEERVSDADLASCGFSRGRYGYTVHQYIVGAETLGLVPEGFAELANEVRDAGNRAVHAAPGLGQKPFELVIKLWLLLLMLFPADTAE